MNTKFQIIGGILLVCALSLSACVTPEILPAPVPAVATVVATAGIAIPATAQAEATATPATSPTPQTTEMIVGIFDPYNPLTMKLQFPSIILGNVFATNTTGALRTLLAVKTGELREKGILYKLWIAVNGNIINGEAFAIEMQEAYPEATVLVFHEDPLKDPTELTKLGINIAERAAIFDPELGLPALLGVPPSP